MDADLETQLAQGSISASLSGPFYVIREETSGEECGLLSRTATGNRA